MKVSKTNLLVFQKKSLKCFCSVIKLRLKSLQINERSLKLCINSEEVIIQPIETLILGVSIIGTVRQTCRSEKFCILEIKEEKLAFFANFLGACLMAYKLILHSFFQVSESLTQKQN